MEKLGGSIILHWRTTNRRINRKMFLPLQGKRTIIG